jgi:hypothetical protein
VSLIKLIDFVVFVLHSSDGVKQSECISKCAELGLAPAFMGNKAFHIWVKRILACPYLPLAGMEDYLFLNVLQYLSNDDEPCEFKPAIHHFADYVTTQWLENASVPQVIWNIYDRDDDDRRNNCCEMWHSK